LTSSSTSTSTLSVEARRRRGQRFGSNAQVQVDVHAPCAIAEDLGWIIRPRRPISRAAAAPT
jgi:hypothetical protein